MSEFSDLILNGTRKLCIHLRDEPLLRKRFEDIVSALTVGETEIQEIRVDIGPKAHDSHHIIASEE
jgi:hypothetical protein